MTMTAPEGTAYELTGPKDAPVVALIHGFGLNRAAWQWTRPALADRYRVLSYDLFGHGQSAEPPTKPTLGLFSRQLIDLMDHTGIGSAGIVGFSLGGMIARRVAQDAPARVAALAILNSPHERTPEAQEAIRKRVVQARSEGPASTVEAALSRWFTDGFRGTHPEMMELVRRWIMSNDPSVYHRIYEVLANGVDEIVRPDPPIACPTLVMTADEDFGNGPEMTRAIAAEIGGAEICILEGLRHMAMAEDPEAVNGPLRDFMDRAMRRPQE